MQVIQRSKIPTHEHISPHPHTTTFYRRPTAEETQSYRDKREWTYVKPEPAPHSRGRAVLASRCFHVSTVRCFRRPRSNLLLLSPFTGQTTGSVDLGPNSRAFLRIFLLAGMQQPAHIPRPERDRCRDTFHEKSTVSQNVEANAI